MPPEQTAHIVISGGRTSVDTDELIASYLRLRSYGEDVEAVITALARAEEAIRTASRKAPIATPIAAASVAEALALATAVARRINEFCTHLAYAAAIYIAAEGDAQRFHAFEKTAEMHLGTAPTDSSHPSNGAHPLKRFILEHTIEPGARMEDIGAAGLAFAFGESDLLSSPRTQFDIDGFGRHISARTPLTWGDAPPDNAVGTQRASQLAGVWAQGASAWAKGRPTGVVISTGTGDAAMTRVVPSNEPAWSGAVLVPGGGIPVSAGLFSVFASLGNNPVGTHLRTRSTPVVPDMPPGQAPTPTVTPHSPSQALAALSGMRSGGDEGQITVLRHDTPDVDGTTTRSWSVIIRGTQQWGAGGTNPQDMLTNFQAVSGADSDQRRAVLAAMDMAGIAPGENVELVGHSQGGIIAAQLGSDPDVVEHYSVSSVLTAGSPTAASPPAPGVSALHLENTRDLVPALDGAANRADSDTLTVHFDGAHYPPEVAPDGVPTAHDLGTYRTLMESIEGGESGDVYEWEEHRRHSLGLEANTASTAFVFDTRRTYEPQ